MQNSILRFARGPVDEVRGVLGNNSLAGLQVEVLLEPPRSWGDSHATTHGEPAESRIKSQPASTERPVGIASADLEHMSCHR